MSLTIREKKFCELVRKAGLVSSEQLEDALQYQHSLPEARDIRTVFREKKYLTAAQINLIEELLNWRHKHLQLRAKNLLEKTVDLIIYARNYGRSIYRLHRISCLLQGLREQQHQLLAELGIKVLGDISHTQVLEKDVQAKQLLGKIRALHTREALLIPRPLSCSGTSAFQHWRQQWWWRQRQRLASWRWHYKLVRLYPYLVSCGQLVEARLPASDDQQREALVTLQNAIEQESNKRRALLGSLLKEQEYTLRGYWLILSLSLYIFLPLILVLVFLLWPPAARVLPTILLVSGGVLLLYILNAWRRRWIQRVIFLSKQMRGQEGLLPKLPLWLSTHSDADKLLAGIQWLTRQYPLNIQLHQILFSGDWLRAQRPELSPQVAQQLYQHVAQVAPYLPVFPSSELLKRNLEMLDPAKLRAFEQATPLVQAQSTLHLPHQTVTSRTTSYVPSASESANNSDAALMQQIGPNILPRESQQTSISSSRAFTAESINSSSTCADEPSPTSQPHSCIADDPGNRNKSTESSAKDSKSSSTQHLASKSSNTRGKSSTGKPASSRGKNKASKSSSTRSKGRANAKKSSAPTSPQIDKPSQPIQNSTATAKASGPFMPNLPDEEEIPIHDPLPSPPVNDQNTSPKEHELETTPANTLPANAYSPYQICAHCGAKVNTAGNICPRCNYEIVPEVTTVLPVFTRSEAEKTVECPSCGLQLASGVRICSHCGVHFSEPLS